jgi:lipoprotein-releasing system permease protein
MNIEYFIAKRYLVSKHKLNFISIISLLSIFGITIGVAALVIVLSVFNGFEGLVQSFLMKFDPHLRLEIISENVENNELRNVESFLKKPEIKSFSPYISGKILCYRSGKYQIANLKGIESDKINSVYEIGSSVLFGKADLNNSQLPKIVLGINLADKLQVITGDTITLVSPANIENSILNYSAPKMLNVIVIGIYSSNNNEYDQTFLFTDISTTQNLFGYANRIQGYDIKLTDPDKAYQIKSELQSQIDSSKFLINTWYDFHKELYNVMQIERWSAYIILSLIIAVSTFNMLGSLSMSVIEKKREIGVLFSLGLEEKSILRIFMYEGILIGIIGTMVGLLIGYFVCWLQLNYNIYPLDPTQYKINSLPIEIKISDFFFIVGASFSLTFLASLIPARKASKLNPIDSIKWE